MANGQPSATPILDLIEPLPEPDKEPLTGRFALPFLTVVAIITFTGNLPTLAIPIGFLMINFLATLCHECGHLTAGWCVGLRFKAVRIDPFRLRFDSGKWKFRVRPRLFWGYAYMGFDRVRRIRSRLIISVIGGPVASLLCGICGIFIGEVGLTRHYDSAWPTFLEFFGAWSLFIGSVSLIPFKARGFANDGMILRGLLFRREEALPVIASYAFSAIRAETPFEPPYFMRWFRLAAKPSTLQGNHYASNWLAYSEASHPETAAQFLERCLAESSLMDDEQRDYLIAEAAFFTAWRRNDPRKALAWLDKLRPSNRLHPLWISRVRIALLSAEAKFDQAFAEMRRALALIREQPTSARRQKLEAEWTSWNEEMHQRALVPTP